MCHPKPKKKKDKYKELHIENSTKEISIINKLYLHLIKFVSWHIKTSFNILYFLPEYRHISCICTLYSWSWLMDKLICWILSLAVFDIDCFTSNFYVSKSKPRTSQFRSISFGSVLFRINYVTLDRFETKQVFQKCKNLELFVVSSRKCNHLLSRWSELKLFMKLWIEHFYIPLIILISSYQCPET